MSTQTETKTVTYTQDGEDYLFLRDHGVRSDLILKMKTADCGHPMWVAEQITKGMDPDFAASVERLQTRANNACLVLESWVATLRQMVEEHRSFSGGYSPESGIAVTEHLRAAINGAPSEPTGTPCVVLGFTQDELDAMAQASGGLQAARWIHDLVDAALSGSR